MIISAPAEQKALFIYAANAKKEGPYEIHRT